MFNRVLTSAFLSLMLAQIPVVARDYPAPAETLAEFQAVCKRLEQGTNAFFGTRVIDELTARLENADFEQIDEAELRIELATELIRVGRHTEAIAIAREVGERAELFNPRSDLLLRAVAQLQLAEDQNCIDRHTTASCIWPIRPEGVHRAPELAAKAGDLYLEYLSHQPSDHHIKWLLNLSRMLSGNYPDGVPLEYRLAAESLDAKADMPRWIDVASSLGVDSFDLAGGAVMDDFDGDGFLDLISSSWDPCEPLKAFRNDGRGGFEDVAAQWGLDAQLGGLNLMHADYDNDGALDLLVLRGAWMGKDGRIRNSLLRNDLDRPAGRFVDVTAAAGLAYPAYPTQTAAWSDYDGDGDLDVYVGNEADQATLMTYSATGDPYPSQLFRNNGDGTFTDVARAAGVANRRYTKGVAWGDYNNDGLPDLYVSTYGDNRLYRNGGSGRFVDVAPELGVTAPHEASFATWFFDYDNDGDLDLFAADYGASTTEVLAAYFGVKKPVGRPRVFRNEGTSFTELSAEVGLDQPLLPMGANYGDLDNDGFLDFYLGTGIPAFDALMPNVMYRNRKGVRFEDVTLSGGFGHLQKGHGIAFGDIDNDGDQDLFQQLGGAYPFDRYGNALYDNPTSATSDNAWIVLQLVGRKANRFAVGARIEVKTKGGEGERSFHALVGTGGSFGGSSLQQELGLGSAEEIVSINVQWPGSGVVQKFRGPLSVRKFYRAVEGEASLEVLDVPAVSWRLPAKGHEEPGHSTEHNQKKAGRQ